MAANSLLTPDVLIVKRMVDHAQAGDVLSYAFDTGELTPLDATFFGNKKQFVLPSAKTAIAPVTINVEAIGDLQNGKVEVRINNSILFFAFDNGAGVRCPAAPVIDARMFSASTFNANIVPDQDAAVQLRYFGNGIGGCPDPRTYIRFSMSYEYREPGFADGVKRTILESYHTTLVGGMGEPVLLEGQMRRDPHSGGFVVTHDNGEPKRNMVSLSGRGVYRQTLPDGRTRSFTAYRSRGELYGQQVSFSSGGSCQRI